MMKKLMCIDLSKYSDKNLSSISINIGIENLIDIKSDISKLYLDDDFKIVAYLVRNKKEYSNKFSYKGLIINDPNFILSKKEKETLIKLKDIDFTNIFKSKLFGFKLDLNNFNWN